MFGYPKKKKGLRGGQYRIYRTRGVAHRGYMAQPKIHTGRNGGKYRLYRVNGVVRKQYIRN